MTNNETETSEAALLIDDFSKGDGVSALGAEWRCFTDQVMGGVSEASHSFEEIDGRKAIRLQGNVSLENNGGFVQVALPLNEDEGSFDASAYRGLRLVVRGNGEDYSVHIKSTRTRLPWQFFYASFPTSDEWQTVEIPFDEFKPENMIIASLNPAKIKRIGIVGAKKEFRADVAVARIEFYK